MSVTVETPIANAVANGVATSFPYSFTVLLAADLVVTGSVGTTTTTYVLGVDYTVGGLGTPAGAVNFVAAPSNGTKIAMFRRSVLQRATDYQTNGDLPAATVNADFDRIWLAIQELSSVTLKQSLRAPQGETLAELPNAAARAGYLQGYDSLGQSVMVPGQAGSATTLAIDLADSATASKGAGQIGFGYALGYAAGTIGKWLKDLATATGATFIGWKASLTGSVLRTLAARLGDRVSVLDFGADPTGAANSAAAIQAAIDAAKRVYIPNGNYNIGTTGLLITDKTVLDFESRNARIFGTVSGAMIASRDNGTTRRYHAMIFSGSLDNTNRATAGGIGIDFKAMTMAKVFGTFITNVETGVRNLGVNPLIGSFYNEFHGVDISGVVTGYDNGTLGNENKVFGGRVNDCVTGTRDNDNSGNTYVSLAIETFTGRGHLNADTTATTNIKYMFSRLENPPTSGVGIDIRAAAQVCSYIMPQFVGLTTTVSDASATADTNGWSDNGLVLKSSTPLKKILRVQVVKDVASLAAGASRQEQFTVPGYANGDAVFVTLPVTWPNIQAGTCINGGAGLVYVPLTNNTAGALDPPSDTFTFTIMKF